MGQQDDRGVAGGNGEPLEPDEGQCGEAGMEGKWGSGGWRVSSENHVVERELRKGETGGTSQGGVC